MKPKVSGSVEEGQRCSWILRLGFVGQRNQKHQLKGECSHLFHLLAEAAPPGASPKT